MGRVQLDIHLPPIYLYPVNFGLTGALGGDGNEFST